MASADTVFLPHGVLAVLSRDELDDDGGGLLTRALIELRTAPCCSDADRTVFKHRLLRAALNLEHEGASATSERSHSRSPPRRHQQQLSPQTYRHQQQRLPSPPRATPPTAPPPPPAAGGVPAHRRALAREAACFEALMRAAAAHPRCPARAAPHTLIEAVAAFQGNFRRYLAALRAGVPLHLIENLRAVPCRLCLSGDGSTLTFMRPSQGGAAASPPARRAVPTATLQRVRFMARPSECFVIETEDEVLGPFQAPTVRARAAVVLGLMSVASTLQRQGLCSGGGGSAPAGELLWQGVRLCISELVGDAEDGAAADEVDGGGGGGGGALTFVDAVAWVQAALAELLELHGVGAHGLDLRIQVDA